MPTIVLCGEVGGDKGRGDPSGGGEVGGGATLLLIQLHHDNLARDGGGEGGGKGGRERERERERERWREGEREGGREGGGRREREGGREGGREREGGVSSGSKLATPSCFIPTRCRALIFSIRLHEAPKIH